MFWARSLLRDWREPVPDESLKPRDAHDALDRRAAGMVWLTALVGLVLAGERAIALRSDLAGLNWGGGVQLLLRGLWQDWLILLALSYLANALLRLDRLGSGRWAAWLFAALAILLALLGGANVVALKMLGAPVTADWLAYSDIAHTGVILDSLVQIVPPGLQLAILAAVVALLLVVRGLAARPLPGAGVIVGLLAIGTVLGLGLDRGAAGSAASVRLQSPVWAFIRSMGAPPAETAVAALAARPGGSEAFASVPGLARPAPPPKPIRNILLFAYESTPAGMAEGWSGRYPVTPNLAAALPQALAFDRAYAHVPASNYFLVAAFAGLVPELSATSMTEPGRLTGFPSLARVAEARGMRTAFFNSSDNRFQNTGGFATEMGFDHVVDYRDWSCAEGIFAVESITDRFRNTSSDLCTADQIIAWIDAAPKQPFFLAFRTGMTHYPYFSGPDPQHYTEDETQNRYLNALRVGDAAFGRIMAHLQERGLAEDTLVIVMGDHGEAFGEHGTTVHAAGIYEENVHIPFALINPQLFHGERTDLITGLSDVAPTVADLLGLDVPWQWEGHSVFAPARPDGVLIFAPWNGFQIGYREGDEKFIYNANTGVTQRYDLASDPGERQNTASSAPSQTEAARVRLAAAVSAHRGHISAVLDGEAPKPVMMAAAATAAPPARPVAQDLVLTVSGTRFGAAPKGWVMLDGANVGGFEVPGAPDTTAAAASPEAIVAAMTDLHLPLQLPPCARELDIWFLNDAWAGEGLTGDTDLVIRAVRIGPTTYHANRFRLLTKGAGKVDGEDFRLWRKGGVAIDLEMSPDCLGAALAGQ